MPSTLKKCVALVGMMGAGKTAVGQALARRLEVPFLDNDSAIEEAANMTIAEIFARDGERFFRRKESQVLERLLQEHRGILSTGGGAYLKPQNRHAISDFGIAVWLKADLDLLWSRVRHKDTRPLLRTDNPKQTLSDLLTERTPEYAKAEITVETRPEFSIEDTADRVIEALRARPDVLEVSE